MYVKALRDGFYDHAGNGKFTETKAGTVFKIPDTIVVKAGSWVVKCDKQGNVIDPVVARKDAELARARANKEAEQAKTATAKAAKEQKEADEAEKRAKELESAAAGHKGTDEPPKDPPKA